MPGEINNVEFIGRLIADDPPPQRSDNALFELYLRDTGLWRQPSAARDVLRGTFMAGLKAGAEREGAKRG